jgi:hypothetical protein
VFPGYDWLPWKFLQTPNNYWDELKNKKKFVEWAGKQLGIKQYSDWYKVTTEVLYFCVCV